MNLVEVPFGKYNNRKFSEKGIDEKIMNLTQVKLTEIGTQQCQMKNFASFLSIKNIIDNAVKIGNSAFSGNLFKQGNKVRVANKGYKYARFSWQFSHLEGRLQYITPPPKQKDSHSDGMLNI